MTQLVWFKRDLRVHDHAPLAAAVATGEPVLPLYILEPDLWRQPEMARRHFAFLSECLGELDEALAQRGARLIVRVGEAVQVLCDLHAAYDLRAIHAHEETGLLWTFERDKAVRRWARRANIPCKEYRQNGVWRARFDRQGWAGRWEAMMRSKTHLAPVRIRAVDAVSDLIPEGGSLGMPEDLCPERQTGGRREAVLLLRSFLTNRGRFYRRAMASPVAGAAACSRISAHLAMGCLSMRETYQATLRAKARWQAVRDQDFAESIASFASRLHWRCHFMQKLEDEPEMEKLALHPAYEGLRRVGSDHEAIVTAWAQGRTGFPFVDACLRSLRATGWLNFRMRSMVMAFSSYHLWQDWRRPGQALARLFTDFEPGVHFPQVQMQSGVTGVNIARIYNPIKQSRDQDPEGALIRRWVPEIGPLPDEFVHEPWTAPPALLAAKGIVLGETYALRLVDHETAARQARQSVYAVRAGEAFFEKARDIQRRHGSRKSGLPSIERPARPKPKAKPAQTEFDF